MELQIGVAKVDKYGESHSGDTVEVIERPNGGISIVLADGQKNHHSNKSISTMVSHRIIGHITEGLRDGLAIRAAAQAIYNEHQGAVTANLNVLSADLQTNTILISRNNPMPIFLITEGKVDCSNTESAPIGESADIIPTIIELPIRSRLAVVIFTDGVHEAGRDDSQDGDTCTIIEALIEEQEPSAQEIAEGVLKQAIRLDDGRPKDDMSVVVLNIAPQSGDQIRRMNITMSLP